MSAHLSIIAVAVSLTGCMPKYKYEQPTLPVAITSEPQRCYEHEKIALTAGEGSWSEQHGFNTGFATYVRTEFWNKSGIAFYSGGSIRPADQVIATLPDPDLALSYERDLARTKSAHSSYPKWRNASLGLAFGGLGMALGGLAMTLANPDGRGGLYLALGGAGVAVTATIPAILTARTHDEAIEHDIDRHLFVKSQWAGRLVAAVGAHNQNVAAACQYDQPDLSLTPRVQQLLGPAATARP